MLRAAPSWVRPNEVNEAASVGAKLVCSAREGTLGIGVLAVPPRGMFVAGEDQSGSGELYCSALGLYFRGVAVYNELEVISGY